MKDIFSTLLKNFGPGVVKGDSETLSNWGRDWTRVAKPAPAAVCFPRSTEEVSRILKFCHDHSVPVVPSGGRTGLSGGAVAAHGEVVLSLDRLNSLGPVNREAGTVRVGAGAITKNVHAHCKPFGLTWPIDFASSGSSQIGGNIATNAGGIHVIRYGMTRHWVQSIEAVTAQGQILEFGADLEKNNTGYDLKQLLIGSEGTLAVITAATLKLAPLPRHVETYLLGFARIESALSSLAQLRTGGLQLHAFEIFSRPCIELVSERQGLAFPIQPLPVFGAILEVDNESSAELVGSALPLDTECLAAANSTQRDLFWKFRETITESLSATGRIHKNDVSAPVHLSSLLLGRLDSEATLPLGAERFVFGHLGDGNLHLNSRFPPSTDDESFKRATALIDQTTYTIIQELGGSISAEHGVGSLKREALRAAKPDAEWDLLCGLKRTFDPKGILNPGKIF